MTERAQVRQTPERPPDIPRIDPRIRDVRGHAARGTLINSAFQIGLSGLGALQRIAVAAFLTAAEYGLWGIILVALFTFGWLRDVGIGDKYLQQNEPDQELAYQKAFTLELASSFAFVAVASMGLPIFALLYDQPDIIVPAILTALVLPIQAFESAAWIPYRRLLYARNRVLTAVDPVVSFIVTVGLAAAGAGYWCFVWGVLAGAVAGAVVCALSSPYRLRLRFDRSTLREYISFSWPLVGAGLSRVLVTHGSLLVANQVAGVGGIGAIGLATGISIFAERVDAIVSQTLYPAVCAVTDRMDTLKEIFVKSNRLALMWALPFGVGLALFAGDLITFVLGERWREAEGLLIAFGLTVALGHAAFNWQIFLRALNRTRPIFVGAVFDVVLFLGVGIPGMLAFGLMGYAAGFAASTAVQVLLRGYYMRQLFQDFDVFRQLGRAVAPTVPPAVAVLLVRELAGEPASLAAAIALLALYAAGVAVLTLLIERSLIVEAVGYLRRKLPREPAPAVAGGAANSTVSSTPADV